MEPLLLLLLQVSTAQPWRQLLPVCLLLLLLLLRAREAWLLLLLLLMCPWDRSPSTCQGRQP